MSDAAPPPWVPAETIVYRRLSPAAKRVMWDILNGDHRGARAATGSLAEREAVDALAVVSDGAHIWVAQEYGHLVPRDRRPPDLCVSAWPHVCTVGPP